ncbi:MULTISPECIES: TetR/AcrR family transcriptional regulator [Rhodomicrobium]|uniref:TetR/AcrR family transcriptional regulator n=1 Tax=Rhodomicrobium TaxID=1068 RepID=UPI000B4B3B82|nr:MULTISPECIES: TetR/AcrR family transcriptional regulator [Rhodomicrobium]
MGKGERTRKDIIDKAFLLAGDIGLEGLSLGALASEAGLSKSGLFAHFKSKEALQLAVIDDIGERVSEIIIRPALAEPRGEPRVRAFFERYIEWIANGRPGGGCIYMALCHEYDDRPGAVRDKLVAGQLEFSATLERLVRAAMDEGHFRADLDPRAFVFEFLGIEMAYQHRSKFLRLPEAHDYARAAFNGLIARSRVPTSPSSTE